MDSRSDGWGHSLATGGSVRGGSGVGGSPSSSPRSTAADRRRFRVKNALRAVEDAMSLLDPSPAGGIDTAALKQVRDDLAVVLRTAEAECR